MRDKKALSSIGAAALLFASVTASGVASAASGTSEMLLPIDGVTQLQTRTSANCVLSDNRCHFTVDANLLTPDGPVGFPGDFWARQTITLRSNDRDVWQEASYSAPAGAPRETKGANIDGVLSKMFKSLNTVEITAVYNGGGPPQRFSIAGDSTPTDWSTGRTATDADFIICSSIHAVFGGHNVTSPTTCSQTRF